MSLFKPFWLTGLVDKPTKTHKRQIQRIEKMKNPRKLKRIVTETVDNGYLWAAAENRFLTDRETLMKLALGDDMTSAVSAVKKLTEEEDLLAVALHDSDSYFPKIKWDEIPENIAADRIGEQEDLLEVALRADHTRNYDRYSWWYNGETWARMAENIAAGRLSAETDKERVAKDAKSWYARYVAAKNMYNPEKAFDILFSYNPTQDTKRMAIEFLKDNDPLLADIVKSDEYPGDTRKAAAEKITDENMLLDIFADERLNGREPHAVGADRFPHDRYKEIIATCPDERICEAMYMEPENQMQYWLSRDAEALRDISKRASSEKVRAAAAHRLDILMAADECLDASERCEELRKAVGKAVKIDSCSGILNIMPHGADTASALILYLKQQYDRHKVFDYRYNIVAGEVCYYLKELYATVPETRDVIDRSELSRFNAGKARYRDEDNDGTLYDEYDAVSFEFG